MGKTRPVSGDTYVRSDHREHREWLLGGRGAGTGRLCKGGLLRWLGWWTIYGSIWPGRSANIWSFILDVVVKVLGGY